MLQAHIWHVLDLHHQESSPFLHTIKIKYFSFKVLQLTSLHTLGTEAFTRGMSTPAASSDMWMTACTNICFHSDVKISPWQLLTNDSFYLYEWSDDWKSRNCKNTPNLASTRNLSPTHFIPDKACKMQLVNDQGYSW